MKRRHPRLPSPCRRLARLGLVSLLPAAAALAAPQQPPPAEPEPQSATSSAAPAGKAMVRGQLRSRYYTRWTSDDSDNDFVNILSLDIGDASKHDYTAHLMGRLAWDLDGRDDTFTSINDSRGGELDALLYDAYVDLHRISGLSHLRIGRQSLIETPEVAWLDGAHATTTEYGALGLLLGGYAGASTHLYESSNSGDLIAGAYAQIRPWTDARLRLDFMHLEDDARLISRDDDLFGVGYWQRLGSDLQFEAGYSRLGNRDRDANARVYYRSLPYDLFVQLRWFTLLSTQGDLVLEADPFFQALNELRPYDQWGLLLGKGVGDWLRLQFAADLRRVDDSGDIGFYNRDYDHYYGTATLTDFGTDGLSLSGTVDFWDSNAQLLRSWGSDLSYAIDRTTLSLGTYYSLYKYDLFSNSERDHVRTWYGRLRHKTSDTLTLECDYELEDNDFDQYQRFRMGVTWRF